MEVLDLLVSLLGAVGTIFGAIFIARQLKLSREHKDVDSIIQKRKETLLIHNELREEFRKLDSELRDKMDIQSSTDILTEEQIREILLDSESELLLKTIFSYLNRIATGIKLEIYDFETIDKLAGFAMIQYFDRYYSYVKLIRERDERDYYLDIEDFVKRIKISKDYNKGMKSTF